jgi:repressor LexA
VLVGHATRNAQGERTRDQILIAVQELTEEAGYPPTFREVADEIGMHLTTVAHHLDWLRAEGRVVWHPRQARTLRLRAVPA